MNYLAAFFAGAFLANALPHLVHGMSGDRFPSPFARPPGRGLSSPTVNVVWALANVFIGYLLLRGGALLGGDERALAAGFAGAAVISVYLSRRFASKHKPE